MAVASMGKEQGDPEIEGRRPEAPSHREALSARCAKQRRTG